MKQPAITVLNGSLGGEHGNTHALLRAPLARLGARARVRVVHLAAEPPAPTALAPLLRGSDAFLFATGTYWDSWGSPLQRFLEDATALEGGDAWLGKPAAALVTMHSVGGKGVLSRLQGVLSTLGCLVPPMSGMVYSLAAHLSLKGAAEDPHTDDLWQRDEIDIICHNLFEAAVGGRAWRAWRTDGGDAKRRWVEEEQ